MLAGLTLMLTGCVRLNVDLEVSKDKTVSGSMIFALSDSLAALGGSTGSLSQGALIDAKTKGVTVRPYAKDGFTGQEYDLKDVSISAFKPNGKNDSFTISQTSKQIAVNGYMDLTDTSGGDATSSQLASMMLSSADIHVTIKFPYKVSSSTGVVSSDKRTVTWKPKIGEKTQLQAVIDIPSTSYMLYVVILISAFLILILLAFFLSAKNKKRRQLQLEQEIRDAELE